jgi:hypothetical protein
MLSPSADNRHNGWQPRAKEQSRRQSRREVPESERSPERENALRGVHRRPNPPPLSLLFLAKILVSD